MASVSIPDAGELALAETLLQRAIAKTINVHRLGVGAFSGSLALLRATQGDFDEARRLMAQSEPLLRDAHQTEWGKLLCKKSRIERMGGDWEAADALLARAEEIADAMTLGDDSELVRAIESARPSPE